MRLPLLSILTISIFVTGAAATATAQTCSFEPPPDCPRSESTIEWLPEQPTFTWTPSNSLCLGEPTTNSLRVRISRRLDTDGAFKPWSSAGKRPTFLIAPPGRSTLFDSETCVDQRVGTKALAEALYQRGARVVEVKVACPISSGSADRQYDDTGSCQHTLLAEVLEVLTETPIGDGSGETIWPSEPANRFAYGISQGQVELQFAVDVFDRPSGEVNRVGFGGGGAVFDLVTRIQEDDNERDGCKVLDAIERSFSPGESRPTCDCYRDTAPRCGRPTDCGGDLGGDCQGQPDLRGALAAGSTAPYLGDPAQDASRARAVLYNTGFDLGSNQRQNLAYCGQRQGEAARVDPTSEAMWNFPDCLCGCPINAHGAISAIAELYGEKLGDEAIADWVDFFHHGDPVFDLDLTDASLCPSPGFDCRRVAPPPCLDDPDSCSCNGPAAGIATACPILPAE
ncbi:MAG: hypothetical protein AAF604_22815 [Acidobacteriota bacterium]